MQLFGPAYKCNCSNQTFPPSYARALGAGMLEKLDLLQEDQNRTEDIVLRYIAVFGILEAMIELPPAGHCRLPDVIKFAGSIKNSYLYVCGPS